MSLLDRNCEIVLQLMTAYLDQTMPTEEVTMLETHMVWCPGCSGFMSQLRAIVQLLGELPIDSISADERDQLVALFRAAAANAEAQ